MAASRDQRLLAIGSDVRLVIAGFGLLLAVGLVSGVGVGLLSSRQLARMPQTALPSQAASGQASLGGSVEEAWNRLRQIAQVDWHAVIEPARHLAERAAVVVSESANRDGSQPAVSPEQAARRVAEGRRLSPYRTAMRTDINRTVDVMLQRFEQQGFDLAALDTSTSEIEVPRIFMASLPIDLGEIDVTEKRKRAFIKVMLPHILRENERIAADRERLLRLHDRLELGAALSERDRQWLTQLAGRYGTEAGDTAALLERVDVIPPALALAQAIEESGWGTSRFAQLGNAVFGQWTWTPGTGIVPEDRPEGEIYEVQRFKSLEYSVAAYMRNLNSKASYREFRNARASMREQDEALDSYRLAGHLQRYSVRGADYIRTIRSIMRSNSLEMFDAARLVDQPTPLFSRIDFLNKS